MTSDRSKEWRDEFDKEFYEVDCCDGPEYAGIFSKNNKEKTLEDVKSFIQSLLDTRRATLIEKVEKLPDRDDLTYEEGGGYATAISDVIKLLKEEL